MFKVSGRALMALLVLPLLLTGACDEKKKILPPEPSPYLARTSPANCLENLITAYVERDSAGYAALFAPGFTFAFSPDDISQDPSIPEQWGWAEEMESAGHMFGSNIVDDIEVSFTQSAADSAFDEYPGAWKVRMSEVELRIYTRTEDGEPLTLKVSDSFGAFYFQMDPVPIGSDADTTWSIWRWEDEPIGLKAMVEESSWGGIKSLYR